MKKQNIKKKKKKIKKKKKKITIKGNLLEGYSAKKNLAEYFGRLNNWDEAINYYQKAYDSIMLLKNKVELRLEAIYNIGRAYEKNSNYFIFFFYYQ